MTKLFQPWPTDVNPNDIKRIVFCSGKIYYELNEKRKKIKNQNVAIIRVEQLFPLNIDFIDKLYNKYNNMLGLLKLMFLGLGWHYPLSRPPSDIQSC